jgi:hypothetical protein
VRGGEIALEAGCLCAGEALCAVKLPHLDETVLAIVSLHLHSPFSCHRRSVLRGWLSPVINSASPLTNASSQTSQACEGT